MEYTLIKSNIETSISELNNGSVDKAVDIGPISWGTSLVRGPDYKRYFLSVRLTFNCISLLSNCVSNSSLQRLLTYGEG